MNEQNITINVGTVGADKAKSSLSDLSSAFSGIKGAGEDLQSSLEQFSSSNPFDKLLGSIGTIGALSQGLSGLSSLMQTVAKHPFLAAILAIGAALAILESETGMVSEFIASLAPIFQEVMTAAQPLFSALADVGAQVMAALVPAFSAFVEALAPLIPQIAELAMQLIGAIAPILPMLAEAFMAIVTALVPLIPIFAELIAQLIVALAPILPLIAEAFMQIVAALIPLIPPLMQMIMAILPVIVSLIQTLVPIIILLAQVFVGILKIAIDAIIGVLNFLMPIIVFIVQLLVSILKPALELVAGIFTILMGILVNVITWFGNMVTAIRDGAVKAWQWVRDTFNKIKDGIRDAISNAINFVLEMPGKILSALSGAGKWLVDIGKNMIQGLLDGAKSLLGNIGKFFLDIVPGWIRGPFEKALGIHSPSRIFMGYGKDILRGLANGIASSAYLAENAIGGLATDLSSDFRASVESGDITSGTANALARPAPVINQYNTNYTEFDQDQALAELTWLYNRARS